MLPLWAGGKRFLWLWLPGLAVFLIGSNRAWLTGQADPWGWAMVACIGCILSGFLSGRAGAHILLWAGMGWIGTIILFCGLAAAQMPFFPATAGLMLLCALAGGGAALLRGDTRSRFCGAVALLLAALLLWRGPYPPIEPIPDRQRLAVITALPLFWSENGSGQPADAPIVTLLRTRFDIVPTDSVATLTASHARRLLLAQPRGMTGEDLIAIDRWVRDGGNALVLADPLLRWPSELPLGDRRRAPLSAVGLAPLLGRWGFPLQRLEQGEHRDILTDGGLLTWSGAAVFGGSLVQQRRVGKGSVMWVGDADLLDDRLWLADPARPFDPRFWSADTPALIAQWLGASMPHERRWMRTERDVVAALRMALLVGTIWAILGAALLGPHFPVSLPSTAHANGGRKSLK